jgi:hypothetical protein
MDIGERCRYVSNTVAERLENASFAAEKMNFKDFEWF